MNFSNKSQLSRAVDTLHTCLRTVFTEKKWGTGELLLQLPLRRAPHAARTHPYDEQER